jgi:hypothetical protein
MGIVSPAPPSPDAILNLIANDREVIESDFGSEYDIARARDRAQERRGIPEDERVYQFSGQVESELLPIVLKMDRDDPPLVAGYLQRMYRYRFKELGDRVLRAALASYSHGGRIDEIRAAVIIPLGAT